MARRLVLVSGVITVLELYQPYQRARRRFRLCIYSGLGCLLLGLEFYIVHIQCLHQHIRHQQHWQQAWRHAQQVRAQMRIRAPVTSAHASSPTLLARLRIVTQVLPSSLWLEQLALQAQRLSITGGYRSPKALLVYCHALQARYPHSRRLQLTVLPKQHFRLELHGTKQVSSPTALTTPRGHVQLRWLAWLQHEVAQQHLQLRSARSAGNHAYLLRFDSTFVAIPYLLARLEQLLGKSACHSLTLRLTPATTMLHASVLCN